MGAICSCGKPPSTGGSRQGSRHGGQEDYTAGHVEGDSETPLVNGGKSKVDFGLGDTHDLIKELGRGGTGETWLCQNKKTGELEAVKFIRRPIPKVVTPMILHEIQIQGNIGEGHINIVNAHEVVLTKTHVALVMEYAAGGSMTSYVADRWDSTHMRKGLFLSEDEARFLFRQFIAAVEYCHRQHVAHRDLKLDNTLLDDSKYPLIKICDFGFAKNWGGMDANMFTQIGTPVYMSPQLINSRAGQKGYDGKKADVWAGGVLLFVMLLGMFPFDHQEHPDPNTSAAHIEVWLQQVKSSWRENPRVAEAAKKLSPECQNLLDQVFDLNERNRITIDGIKQHPWFKKPLLPQHQEALEQLQHRQAELDRLEPPVQKLDRTRDEALTAMIQAASRSALPTEALQRVNLRRNAGHDAAAANGQHHGAAPRLGLNSLKREMAAITEGDEDLPATAVVHSEEVKVEA